MPSIVGWLSLGLFVTGTACAQQASAYGCPLDGSPQIPGPDPLASGAWTTGGWFDDQRAVGVDASRNRIVRFHGALDLAVVAGTRVYAVRAGRVALSENWNQLGNVVVIDHGDGQYTIYGLLGARLVNEGAVVARHDAIGIAGFSGWSAAIRAEHPEATPRIHFALIRGARSGLADAGGPLRVMSVWHDAWEHAIADVFGPIDPTSRMPASCWLGRSTRP